MRVGFESGGRVLAAVILVRGRSGVGGWRGLGGEFNLNWELTR